VIVIDASALLEVLLRTPAAKAVERRLFEAPQQTLHAPHLLDVEVVQVLRRYAAIGRTQPCGACRSCRFSNSPVLLWSSFTAYTAYDAVYVALAEVLNARLLTRDRRLAAAVSRLTGIALA
jgi:predicted nucleic acid-binding protein